MSEIERHEVDTCGDMEPAPDGYWVRYSDHLAALNTERSRGEALREALLAVVLSKDHQIAMRIADAALSIPAAEGMIPDASTDSKGCACLEYWSSHHPDCPTLHGKTDGGKLCQECGGSGSVNELSNDPSRKVDGVSEFDAIYCPACHGSGKATDGEGR